MAKETPLVNFSDPRQRMAAVQQVMAIKGGIYRMELTRCKDQRSLSQNAYMWAVVYPVVAEGMAEASGEPVTVDEVHEFCKLRFLRKPIVDRRSGDRIGWTTPHTSTLDTAEFSLYLENVIKFAGEYLGVEVPPAAPLEESSHAVV